MPMPPPAFIHGPGKGGSAPKRGGRFIAGHSFGRRPRETPLTNPSPFTSVSHSPINGKRPGDGVVDEDRSKKRRKTSTTTPSHPHLATNGSDSTGNTKDNPIQIPDDPPEASFPGFRRHVGGNFLETSPSQTRPAHRYSLPLNPSTPTRRANEEPEVIVIPDDDDDSTTPSRSTFRNAAQSGVTRNPSGLITPKTPSTSTERVDLSCQRKLKYGQARPANSVQEEGETVSTPAHAQMGPMLRTPSRHDQLANGSPGTPKNMPDPFKSAPAQNATKRVEPANRSRFLVLRRKADQYQVPQGSNSVPQVAVRDCDTGARKIDDVTKNRDNERAEGGRVDVGGANRSDAVLHETKNLSQTDPSEESQMLLLGSATVGASQLQEPAGLAIPAQAQKQSELIGDGRSDGGDERARRRSTSLSSEIGCKNDPKGKRRATPKREKKQRIVELKAPPRQLRRISLRPVQRPEIPMRTGTCFLTQMPPEVQKNIFKYLLLIDKPIQVLEQWSKLYRGKVSGLHPAILRTCKAMFNIASAFLYGQNVFQYLVRDMAQPGASLPSKQDNRYIIHVAKYVPLFRRLELKIERRTESGYCGSLASAIGLLNEHGANLHTLTLDLSPSVEGDTLSIVGYFFRDGAIVEALKALRTCFITVLVFPPEAKDDPTARLRRVLDMRTELGVFEEGQKQSPAMQLDDLSEMITFACESPSEVVEQGLFDECNVVPRQDERGARHRRIRYFNNDSDEDADDAIDDANDDDEDDDEDEDYSD